MRNIHRSRRAAACTIVALIAAVTINPASVGAKPPGTQNVKYDATTDAEYAAMWANDFGPGELAAGGTRGVTKQGTTVGAEPFQTGADFSVYDHLKYIAISRQSFNVPDAGSLEFSVDITATTSGTDPDRVIHGCYGVALSYPEVGAPCAQPFQQTVLEGQQAGVVLNMVNFETGQLFDWFVSGSTAFALIERLPTAVTGSPGTPLSLVYTQIIAEVPIKPGKTHNVAIRYTRGPTTSNVEYFLDGTSVASVDHVGIPLDKQGVPYTGYASSTGPGEELKDRLDSFVIGHGLFSLLDAFPYQDFEAPELSVSIPVSERVFGQGATGTWNKFVVTTKTT